MENVSCDWNTTLSPIKLTPCSLVKKKNQNKKKQTYRSTNIKPFIKHSIKTNNIAMGFQLTFCHFYTKTGQSLLQIFNMFLKI